MISIFATQQTPQSTILTASAFIASYFDILSKKNNPKLTIKNRLGQSAATIIIALVFTFQISALSANHFILGRALINSVSFLPLFVIVFRAAPSENTKSKFFDLRKTLFSYLWMAGSNSIFLIPTLLSPNDGIESSLILTAYLIQTSLQLSGRLSDYITLGILHDKRTSNKEAIAISLGITSFLLFTAVATGMYKYGISTLATNIICLTISVVLWGYGDSKYSTLLFQGKSIADQSAVAGLISAILTGCIVTMGSYAFNSSYEIVMLIATLVGSINYAFFAKKKS